MGHQPDLACKDLCDSTELALLHNLRDGGMLSSQSSAAAVSPDTIPAWRSRSICGDAMIRLPLNIHMLLHGAGQACLSNSAQMTDCWLAGIDQAELPVFHDLLLTLKLPSCQTAFADVNGCDTASWPDNCGKACRHREGRAAGARRAGSAGFTSLGRSFLQSCHRL